MDERMIEQFHSKVVGVSFVDAYPDNLHELDSLAGRHFIEGNDEPIPAVLIRNPENPHDGNAIEVHVPALGDGAMIGHLPRDLAARLAPWMDRGEEWQAGVSKVFINPDHPDRPGIDIAVWRRTEEAAS